MEPALALAASSQFRMVMSQTNRQLQLDAIEVIELVSASFILDQSYSSGDIEMIHDMEIIIQESELVLDMATTRIKFFALTTYLSNFTNDPGIGSQDSAQPQQSNTVDSQRQADINDLITSSFLSQDQINMFLERLRNAVILLAAANNNTDAMMQIVNVTNIVVALASPAQFPPASNDTLSDVNTSSISANLSPLDKIIVSVSCGIFVGLIIIIFWHLREIRHYIATQHQLILRNNTSGSFPHPSPYDPYDVESTSSGNEDDAVGHCTITSEVNSSSSFNDQGMRDKKKFEIVVKEVVQSPLGRANNGSPQLIPSEFPYLYVDSPEFHNLDESLNTVDHIPLEMEVSAGNNSQLADDTEPTIESFVNDSVFSQHDQRGTNIEDTVKLYESDSNTTNHNDEEISVEDFVTTPFDISSVGNLSLEQSMASSTMK